jgi:hypothetical protein
MYYSQKVKEPLIQSLSNSQSVSSLDDMRTFLEQLYTVTYTSPNSIVQNNIENSVCYQISILGTYIPSVLSSIPNTSMEDLFQMYGSPPLSSMVPSQTPPVSGILTTTQDYVMLLRLYIAGYNLSIVNGNNDFNEGEYVNDANSFKIWRQDVVGEKVVTKDECATKKKETEPIISYSVSLYTIIKECLEHFHNQIANSKSITHGDLSDTSEGMTDNYQMYINEMCTDGSKSGNNICKGKATSNNFFGPYTKEFVRENKLAKINQEKGLVNDVKNLGNNIAKAGKKVGRAFGRLFGRKRKR